MILKSKKWILIIFLILIVAGIFIFIRSRSPTGALTSITTYTQGDEEVVDPDTAKIGDLVRINYVLRLEEDNSVVDTNNAELAEEFGVKNYVKGPFTFILGKSGKVKGFDEAILEMKPGESKTATIPPSEPLTAYTLDIVQKTKRNKIIPRQQVFPLSRYKEFFKRNPVVGDVVYNPLFPWLYRVLEFSENSVLTEIIIKVGDEIVLSGTDWSSVVLQVTDRTITFRQNPEEGQIINSKFGTAVISLEDRGYISIRYDPKVGTVLNYETESDIHVFTITSLFEITEVSDAKFVIEKIDNLAERALILEVEVLEVEKT